MLGKQCWGREMGAEIRVISKRGRRLGSKEGVQKLWKRKTKTSNAGSLYSCGRWAGTSNPHPYPMPPTHTQKPSKSRTLIFALFNSCPRTNGPTDGSMDGQILKFHDFCCLLRNKGYTDYSWKITDQSDGNSEKKHLIDQSTIIILTR